MIGIMSSKKNILFAILLQAFTIYLSLRFTFLKILLGTHTKYNIVANSGHWERVNDLLVHELFLFLVYLFFSSSGLWLLIYRSYLLKNNRAYSLPWGELAIITASSIWIMSQSCCLLLLQFGPSIRFSHLIYIVCYLVSFIASCLHYAKTSRKVVSLRILNIWGWLLFSATLFIFIIACVYICSNMLRQ